MDIQIGDVQIKRKESAFGFEAEKLVNPPVLVKMEAKAPLYIVNSYRKTLMSVVGVHKLSIKYFETSDPFLVSEFISCRIKQIPINN